MTKKEKRDKLKEDMKKYNVDDDGFIVDENGDPVLDAEGNRMRPEDLI
jgi:hypothetical protein